MSNKSLLQHYIQQDNEDFSNAPLQVNVLCCNGGYVKQLNGIDKYMYLTEIAIFNCNLFRELKFPNTMQTITTIKLKFCENIVSLNFTEVPELLNLCVTQCNIKQININQNSKIQQLDLSGNKLSVLDLTNQINLHKLDINRNNFINIDLSACTQIRDLNINSNQFKDLNLRGLQCLEQIKAMKNQLIELNCLNFSTLKFVTLSWNPLVTAQLLFASQLCNIDLSNCKIQKLPDFSQQSIQSLRVILLHNNLLSDVQDVLKLAKFCNIHHLSLYGNPICETNAYHFIKSTIESNLHHNSQLQLEFSGEEESF